MACVVAFGFLCDVFAHGLVEVYAGLVGYAGEHPEHVGNFVGQVGLFARFAFISPGVLLFEAVTGYLAIALGALSWWFGITYFVNKVRARFNLRGIWILNRVIGSIVAIVSILGLVFTLMGESLY